MYQDLEFNDSIRICELLPAQSESEELQCRLKHKRLSEQAQYEAVSYTWGPQAFPAKLYNVDTQSYFNITENLCAALKRFRLPNDIRALWVDFICINQEDLAERSLQVRNIAEIYKSAQEVLVWLEEFDASEGITEIERISACSPDGKIPEEVLTGINFAALNVILGRDWFKRVWTIQEHGCGREVQFHCGAQRLDSKQLGKIIIMLYGYTRMGNPVSSFMELGFDLFALDNAMFMFLVRGHMLTKPFQLLQVCNKTRRSQCSDDRDRVYGLLGVHGNSNIQIQPNYSLGTSEVYWDLAKAYIKAGDLSILNMCYISPFAPKTFSMPSWTPDWRWGADAPLFAEFDRETFTAGRARPSHIRLLEDSELPAELQERMRAERDLRLYEAHAEYAKTLSEQGRGESATSEDTHASSNDKALICRAEGSICIARGVLIDYVVVVPDALEEHWEAIETRSDMTRFERTRARNQKFERAFLDSLVGGKYVDGENWGIAFARTIVADNATSATSDKIGIFDKEMSPILLRNMWGFTKLTQFDPDGNVYWESKILERLKVDDEESEERGTDESSTGSHEPAGKDEETTTTEQGSSGETRRPPARRPVPNQYRRLLLPYWRALAHLGYSRTFFVTNKGYIGLAPLETTPLDAICILDGGRTAYVLRPAQSEGSFPGWILIGECYVHGLMYGEIDGLMRDDPTLFTETEFAIW